jgi:hypothetical protein
MLYSRDGQRALIGELLEATRIPAAGPLVIRSVPGWGSLAFSSTRANARRTCRPMRLLGGCAEYEVLDRLLTDTLPPAQGGADGDG